MFKYLVKQPKQSNGLNKALLMLHGFGSNEADLFSLASYFPDDLWIFSARAPLALDFGGYAWYPIYIDAQNQKISDGQQAFESVLQLSDFIDFLQDKYQISPDNFNLLGFSQGAILSYALALNYPDKVKNIMALSGYINDDIMPVNENKDKYKQLNFFISHGVYDDVIPIDLARKIPPYLDERQIRYTYKEYPMGHEINQECLNDMVIWAKENL